jgi:hypothetical protein
MAGDAQRAVHIGVADAVKHAHQPDVAGAVEDEGEEQADGERRREHADDIARRPPRGEVVEVQGAEGVREVRQQRPAEVAEPPRELRLQDAAVDELLIEAPEQLAADEQRCPRPEAGVVHERNERPGVDEEEDRVGEQHHLREVELLGDRPVAPAQEADVGEAGVRPAPDGEQRSGEQQGHPEPGGEVDAEPAQEVQARPHHQLEDGNDEQQPQSRRRRVRGRRALVKEKQVAAQQRA